MTPEELVQERRFIQEKNRVDTWMEQKGKHIEQGWEASPAGQRSLESELVRHDRAGPYNPADSEHRYIRGEWWHKEGQELAYTAAVNESVRQGVVPAEVARGCLRERAESLSNHEEFGYQTTHRSLGVHAAEAFMEKMIQKAPMEQLGWGRSWEEQRRQELGRTR